MINQKSKPKHYLLFFLDDFHKGAVNHIIHSIGFTVLGYGLGKPNLILIVISPFIMEMGHLYNYTKGVHKEFAAKIIPLQLFAWLVFVVLGYLLSKILGG